MSWTTLLLPTHGQMLRALPVWLGKAEAQRSGGGADARPSARLAPDMFPPGTQIRFACGHAHEAVFRLTAQTFRHRCPRCAMRA